MQRWRKKQMLIFLSLIAFVIALTGCGSSKQNGPTGDLSVVNEQGETVTLTNKESATILFHFTGVG